MYAVGWLIDRLCHPQTGSAPDKKMASHLLAALSDVKAGVFMSLAAKVHRVSLTTLHRHHKQPYGYRKTAGRPLVFSELEEQTLEDMLILCSDLMIGMSPCKFRATTAECARQKGLL